MTSQRFLPPMPLAVLSARRRAALEHELGHPDVPDTRRTEIERALAADTRARTDDKPGLLAANAQEDVAVLNQWTNANGETVVEHPGGLIVSPRGQRAFLEPRAYWEK
jgi:hypothetical protein